MKDIDTSSPGAFYGLIDSDDSCRQSELKHPFSWLQGFPNFVDPTRWTRDLIHQLGDKMTLASTAISARMNAFPKLLQ